MRPHRPGSTAGFTLLELAVTITVLAILAGMGAGIAVEAGRAYSRTVENKAAFSDVRFAANKMALEMANIRQTSHIYTMEDDEISFTALGFPRVYWRSGSTLRRNLRTFVRSCSQFELTYYRADGTEATQPSEVHRIAVEIAVTRDGRTARIRTEVFPRSFREGYASWQEE
jgi:prepilin-type N-terminal cleavage/methylation domain-containing protein